MFQKTKRFFSGLSFPKKAQMLCLMMVLGATSLMAQNVAGDYSAGTAALTQVSEEFTKYVPIVVELLSIAGASEVRSVYIAITMRSRCQEKDHDDYQRIFPYSCCSGATCFSVCHSKWGDERRGEHYPVCPVFKGCGVPLWVFRGAIFTGQQVQSGCNSGFIIAYCIAGFILGLAILAIAITIEQLILFKQRKGLQQ